MPIEISCTSCNKRLRVPDHAAGKRVKCPQCQTILSVPAGGGSSVAAGGSSVVGVPKYHLKTEDGQTFGPVPKKELDQWMNEGRITADCQLLREGADQWQWATDLYPQLEEEGGGATATSASSSGGFPNIDTGGNSSAEDNPFAFAADDLSPSARISGGRRKHRGAASRTAPRASAGPAAGAATGELSDKSKMVAGLLCLFLGAYGVGRFYLGYTNIGLLQLFTCGGCGIWTIIDTIQVFSGNVPDARGRPLRD